MRIETPNASANDKKPTQKMRPIPLFYQQIIELLKPPTPPFISWTSMYLDVI